MATIELDIPLEVIHKLYAQAIVWDTTIDGVVERILREYIDKHEDNNVCTWSEVEQDIPGIKYYVSSCGADIYLSTDIDKINETCMTCGKKVRGIDRLKPVE